MSQGINRSLANRITAAVYGLQGPDAYERIRSIIMAYLDEGTKMGADLDLSAVYEIATPAGKALIDLNCQVLNGGFAQWFDNCEPTPETFEVLAYGLARIPDTTVSVPYREDDAYRATVARGRLVRGVLALVKLAGQALVRRPTVRLRVGFAWRWEATVEPLDDLYYALDDDALIALVAEYLTEESTDERRLRRHGGRAMKTYGNPRREALIEGWPSGARRVTARFWIETHPRRGERVVRQTTGKPKAGTYAERCAIVDGDDGRTYYLKDWGWHITVFRGDMKYDEESRFPGQPGYEELAALLENRS